MTPRRTTGSQPLGVREPKACLVARASVGALCGPRGWGAATAVDSLVPMTNTANGTLTDVHDMIVVHRAFRREFTLLPQLVRDVAAGDTARAAVVAKHALLLLDGPQQHHTSEDLL